MITNFGTEVTIFGTLVPELAIIVRCRVRTQHPEPTPRPTFGSTTAHETEFPIYSARFADVKVLSTPSACVPPTCLAEAGAQGRTGSCQTTSGAQADRTNVIWQSR